VGTDDAALARLRKTGSRRRQAAKTTVKNSQAAREGELAA